MVVFEGGCECGAVRYRMTSEPIFVNCCHCRQCQKITGSAFAINAMIESDRLEVLQGEAGVEGRCGKCNVLLWGAHRLFGDRVKFLRVGTLDEAERIRPNAHFFIRSKHPWVTIPDDVQSFEALPTDRDPPALSLEAKARLEAVRGD
jgi:hypothetical protein